MTVKELAKMLSLKPLNEEETSRKINGAYAGDLLSWVMGKAKSDNVWITIMSNVNVIAVASLCDVSMVILSEDSVLDDEAMKKAEMQGINIYSSELTTFDLCVRVGELLKKDTDLS